MEAYRRIADAVAADIAAGRLRPGDRLPPQRRFARQRGIATSTAARVFAELVRRGLVTGEVGRGTFVRAAPGVDGVLAEPGRATVDLELNFPVVPEQAGLLAEGLRWASRPEVLGDLLRPVGVGGTPAARDAAAAVLARPGWAPDPARVVFAGSGREAIAATIAALVPAGQRLGVEELTYPVVKATAARLGVVLVPLRMDEHGVLPEAVRAAGSLRAVYLQPTLHNPLGGTMPAGRRAELAEVVRELDLPAVEDLVNAFLREDVEPLAALVPEQAVVVDSLSKRVAPGLTLGYVVSPRRWVERIGTAVRAGGWAAGGFALAAATRWSVDGVVATIGRAKRRDAARRQRLVAERLAGFRVRADPGAYHCWWELPAPWRAEVFVAAAARAGIAVSPGAAFTVGPGRAPDAVRLALAGPEPDTLAGALDVLAALARGQPEDAGIE
ncbi:DNA-binding transcriptional regulator, MocR family, contains an aminotransferase domain [Amycolatopsis arida]|uniref:DNA-binding transcriptional regulator, MocR family, contains an aminotransferase domain n=1 Tax=Amycolatopsis arida TaxID=587909 RepID=A0A1I5YEJ9_9PSEU|nr:PLP-dependent aminotransferase family protein [Amycolatopsis arida]TDX90458.1 DNA-binding transcriptional MocR family regulator [Amycolatopsis arida]SFQ42629.1 DNA-binding transcriptional regulator, MocR family, contains an aminotransferase domain [Amycolatopsis arida]